MNQSYGGFGLEYAQPYANGAAVMDQYGMWHTRSVRAIGSFRCCAHTAGRIDTDVSNRLSSRCRTAALPTHDGFFGMDRRRRCYSLLAGNCAAAMAMATDMVLTA